MAEASKDTVYVDVDDEITGIIDKVANSKHNIVALVLPKRAAVLQSIVNMKLLKRSSDANKKKLVLITSEAGLLPLAGAVKLHVAKTLQSKPSIPNAPDVPSDDIALDEAADAQEFEDDDLSEEEVSDKPLDTEKTVGELAAAKKSDKAPLVPDEETIDIDNESTDEPADAKEEKPAKKSDKKLKIPNFDKFRTKLIIGGAAFVGLLIFLYLANFVLPSAKVIIRTDDISVNTNVAFTASTAAKSLDSEKGIVPATEKEIKKTDAEKVAATGKKNVGDKATGTVSLKLNDCAQGEVTIPSGTTLANGSLIFVTQVDISLNSIEINKKCQNTNYPNLSTGTVKVAAQSPGDQYNINGGRKFSVEGFGNVSGFDSSAMSGGTNREVTVVSDQDIETAKNKMADKSKDAALNDLKKEMDKLQLFSIIETFAGDTPAVTASPSVGEEATEVTVTSIVTYRMLGVKRADLKSLVVESAKKQIDTSKQSIENDGLTKAIFQVTDKKSPTEQTLSVQSTVSTGAEIDQDALKKEIAGKKKGEVQDFIAARPGVKEVEVRYSPFWVYKTPKNPKKITFVYEQVGNASSN